MSLVGHGKSKNWTISDNNIEGTDIQKIPINIDIDNLIMK